IQEPQVITVFPRTSKIGRRHNVCCGIDRFVSRHHLVKNERVAFNAKTLPTWKPQPRFQFIPCFDAIEKFEQQTAEENFFGRLLAFIQDMANQELAYPIGSAVNICKAKRTEDRIVSPWWRRAQ